MFRSIRSRLIWLVVAVLVPATIAAGWAVYSTYEREKAAGEQTLRETARALALVVDRELEKRRAVLEVLAASPSLAAGNLEAFNHQALAATSVTGGWLVLRDEQSIRLDTSRPRIAGDAAADAVSERELVEEPAVSVLESSGEHHMGVVWVDVPVRGERLMNLSLAVTPQQLQRIMSDQGLPAGWTAAVLDRSGTVVARQPEPERWVGSPAHPTLRDRVNRLNEGFYDTVTLDGTRVVAFFSKSPAYGWAFAIGVPQTELTQGFEAALIEIAIGAFLLTLLAVIMAISVGGGLARRLKFLHSAAMALERGERIQLRPTGLKESDEVVHALAQASNRLLDANRVLEARVAEAVAETRATQQKLLQSQKMEAVGQLTGGIAHDFNNLLQALLTGQQMLSILVEDPEARQIVDNCNRAVHKAAKLTRQLLAFGRGHEFHPISVDLRDQILAMRDLLTGALRDDIELTINFAPNLWPVHVDPTQLELAILNCALNARDAMEGAGRLRISAQNVALESREGSDTLAGEFVRLTIEDTGHGIPPETLSKVFEPFFTTKEVGKGSGLGLAQVYGFASQSNGSVDIDSEVGRGTTITLLLPRAATPPAQQPDVAPDAHRSGHGRRILFVEDDALVADVVGSALKGLGCHVHHVEDGDRALEVLRSDEQIDIVFSDVVMPGRTNGFELARAVMSLRPGTRVVLATGYSDSGSSPEGVTVLAKPYAIATLVDTLLPEDTGG